MQNQRQQSPHPPRDLIGYGRKPVAPKLPNDAKLAVNFVINYEEGSERTPVNGDAMAENYGHDLASDAPLMQRSLSNESLFEYGSRAGIWRLLDLFERHQLPTTIFATGYAMDLNRPLAEYLSHSSHEIAGHGWRWINYSGMSVEDERESIARTIDTLHDLTGKPISGWYTGRKSNNTRLLLTEFSNIIYDSESYADDLPFFTEVHNKEHLVIPYNLDCNDFGFIRPSGFVTASQFTEYLNCAFDTLYREGVEGTPKLMTIGLHPRISGRPGRFAGIQQFVERIASQKDIWITTRENVAQLWWQMATS